MSMHEIIAAFEEYMDASLGLDGEISRRAEKAIEELKRIVYACEDDRK